MLARFRPVLVSSLLLAGLGACSKKEDVPPVISNGYTLDGPARTCQVSTTTSNRTGFDYLSIELTTVPQPSTGPESLYVTLRKPEGQPAATYDFVPIGAFFYTDLGRWSSIDFQKWTANRSTTSTGGFSATFAGEARSYDSSGGYTVTHTLTAGVFTDARP